ncbi:hypothetical protein HYV73_03940 [Candidatus Uhrbacteria bacterium]|nr:hypothetical protein [Candidatus Uhrbacteria bacterium]
MSKQYTFTCNKCGEAYEYYGPIDVADHIKAIYKPLSHMSGSLFDELAPEDADQLHKDFRWQMEKHEKGCSGVFTRS